MFSLEPNPGLYKKLFDQWEREDALRQQQEQASKSFLASPRNQIVLLLFILVAILQITSLLLRRRLANKREARRRWHFRRVDDKDVEGGTGIITPSGRWDVDVKIPLASGDE